MGAQPSSEYLQPTSDSKEQIPVSSCAAGPGIDGTRGEMGKRGGRAAVLAALDSRAPASEHGSGGHGLDLLRPPTPKPLDAFLPLRYGVAVRPTAALPALQAAPEGSVWVTSSSGKPLVTENGRRTADAGSTLLPASLSSSVESGRLQGRLPSNAAGSGNNAGLNRHSSLGFVGGRAGPGFRAADGLGGNGVSWKASKAMVGCGWLSLMLGTLTEEVGDHHDGQVAQELL